MCLKVSTRAEKINSTSINIRNSYQIVPFWPKMAQIRYIKGKKHDVSVQNYLLDPRNSMVHP